jgi:hypothetical protein
LGHNDALSSSAIVRDAAQGKIQAVRDALNKNPQLVKKNSILIFFLIFLFI